MEMVQRKGYFYDAGDGRGDGDGDGRGDGDGYGRGDGNGDGRGVVAGIVMEMVVGMVMELMVVGMAMEMVGSLVLVYLIIEYTIDRQSFVQVATSSRHHAPANNRQFPYRHHSSWRWHEIHDSSL